MLHLFSGWSPCVLSLLTLGWSPCALSLIMLGWSPCALSLLRLEPLCRISLHWSPCRHARLEPLCLISPQVGAPVSQVCQLEAGHKEAILQGSVELCVKMLGEH